MRRILGFGVAAIMAATVTLLLLNLEPQFSREDGGWLSAVGQTRGDIDVDDIDRAVQAEGSELMALLKQELPAEYAQMLADLAEMVRGGADPDEIYRHSADATARIRRDGASIVAGAPDPALIEVLDTARTLLVAVREQYGKETCARFAARGPAIFDRRQIAPLNEPMDRHGTAMLRAIARARAEETPRFPANHSDQEALRSAFLAAGGTDEDLQKIAANDNTDAAACARLDLLMRTSTEIPGARGARLRAMMVSALAGS
ncbi:MAG: hypothetical protein AAGE18_17150 [Pseudomonadota bacterium]